MTDVVLLVHVLVATVWLGGMVYSLLVVQPKMARFFAGSDGQHESFAAHLAAGNRRAVLALIAVLALTGAFLGYDDLAAVHLVKGGLLVAAAAVFWWVSWRHWPRRVFAVPAEVPALRRQLRGAAWAMVALVGAAFVLSVLMH